MENSDSPDGLGNALANLERNAPDVYIASFAKAFNEVLRESDEANELIVYTLDVRRALGLNASAAYVSNLALRATAKAILADRKAGSYPRDFTEPTDWREAFYDLIVPNDATQNAAFALDMSIRNVQSNIHRRYVAVNLLRPLYKDRWEAAGPKILDIGCSQNYGLKSLARGLPRARIKVVGESDAVNVTLDANLNNLAAEPFKVGRGLGLDVWPADDPQNALWVNACRYPSEHLDEQQNAEYEQLRLAAPDNVSFVELDFSRSLPADLPRDNDIVSFFTIMYQLDKPTRDLMLQNARRSLKPDGIIIIQDFSYPAPDGSGEPVYPHNIYERKDIYRLWVYDNLRPDAGFQPVLTWQDGRCRRVKIETSSSAGQLLLRQLIEYV